MEPNQPQEEIKQPILNVNEVGFWSEVKARIKLRTSLFIYPIISIVLLYALVLVILLIVKLLEAAGTYDSSAATLVAGLSYLIVWASPILIILGFGMGYMKYKKKIKQIPPEQLPSKKYDNMSVVVILAAFCIIFILPTTFIFYFFLATLFLSFVFVQNLKKVIPIVVIIFLIAFYIGLVKAFPTR